MNVKKMFLEAAKSRTFVAMWILLFVQTAVLVGLAIADTHSGLTVQTHCDLGSSVPDCTHAEAPWYYTLNFAVFAVVSYALSVIIGLKLLQIKGRILALGWLWLSVIVMLVGTVLIGAILRVAEL